MQLSEASPVFSGLSQPNGSGKARQLTVGRTGTTDSGPRLVSPKELSKMWDMPESTLRYWRCAGIGPTYVKLGGGIKYDLADVEAYVRANKRKPSVRAHGG
jgi:Helix-turn-helix domain